MLSVALLYSFLYYDSILSIYLNPVIGFSFFILIRFITKKGMGLGDAILSASIAAILGLKLWLPAMTAASLLALEFILFMKLVKKIDVRQLRIPFAPFMSAGAVFFLITDFLN